MKWFIFKFLLLKILNTSLSATAVVEESDALGEFLARSALPDATLMRLLLCQQNFIVSMFIEMLAVSKCLQGHFFHLR